MTSGPALLFLGLAVSLCAPTSAHAWGTKTKTATSSEESAAFAEVDRAIAAKQLLAAAKKSNEQLPDRALMVLGAEHFRLTGEFDLAQYWFNQANKSADPDVYSIAALLGTTLIRASGGYDSALVSELKEFTVEGVPDTMNADRYLVLAHAASMELDADAAGKATKLALSYASSDDEVRTRIVEALKNMILNQTIGLVERKQSHLEKAREALAIGKFNDAIEFAQLTIDDEEVTSGQNASAVYVQQQAKNKVMVSTTTVAVLVPLTGKFGAIGKMIKQSIELGFLAGGGTFKPIVYDSGETSQSAIAALERAVLQDGAIAAIGPIRTDVGPQVASTAHLLGIPLLSLSKSVSSEAFDAWVYQAMVTEKQLVSGLLDHVMGPLQMKSFGIFAPDNDYGHSCVDAFTAEVERRKGKITIVTWYDPKSTDLIPFAQQFGRKDYERDSAVLSRMRYKAKKEGRNPDNLVLPPVIDFDAIFLPDSFTRIPIVVAGLAYEEVPMGNYKPLKEKTTIPLLGLSSWNNDKLSVLGGPYVRHSIFVDAYFKRDPSVQSFIDTYKDQIGRAPSQIEALGYNAGSLLGLALSASPATREAASDAISDIAVVSSVTGAFRVDTETNNIKHTLKILTVGNNGIESAIEPETE